MSSVSIKTEGLTKAYDGHTVLDNINLQINPGEFVCLLGPSGCGKSTLLRLIAGLDKPTKGKVFLDDRDITNLPCSKRNFGIVFQSYALFPNLSAYDNVTYGLKNRRMTKRQIEETANKYLEMVGLSGAKKRFPSQLSGGEQQRVALARALTIEPDFLLLDEPLSALDAKVRVKLRHEICSIQRELGITTIMVTHDQEEALTMADKIVVMDKAKLMQSGTPEEIYDHPQSRFVADFIGAINFYENEGETKAIRPEKIVINSLPGADSSEAVLTDIEFRGNFCRLSARSDAISKEHEFYIDLPTQRVRELKLCVGAPAFVNMPEAEVLHFGGASRS